MRLRSLATALFVLTVTPNWAEAYQAVTTSPVNVRTGAGTAYARLATLPRGASVWVDACRLGWCAVNAGSVTGWVSARYLSGATGGANSYRAPSVYRPPVPPYVPPVVVPRKDYHYYGYGKQHQFQRPIN